VIEKGKHLLKDALLFEIWIFRNGQPDCDDNRRIFVAMTSTNVKVKVRSRLMGTICAPLFTDMFLHAYDADFLQGLSRIKIENLTRPLIPSSLILDFSSVCVMVVYKVEKSNALMLLQTY
jgi:hypothetical protein